MQIINQIDGTITYGKGSAVVRMLYYIITENSFYNGLTAYFKKFQYSNVDQDDLWNSLEEQGYQDGTLINLNIPLSKAMSKWTRQKGHPLVIIKKIDSSTFELTQNRFVLDSTFDREELKKYIEY